MGVRTGASRLEAALGEDDACCADGSDVQMSDSRNTRAMGRAGQLSDRETISERGQRLYHAGEVLNLVR
jgi:hypothetical protein